jgi:hypothetical protein
LQKGAQSQEKLLLQAMLRCHDSEITVIIEFRDKLTASERCSECCDIFGGLLAGTPSNLVQYPIKRAPLLSPREHDDPVAGRYKL